VSIPITFDRPLNTLALSSASGEALEALQKSIPVTICENSENLTTDAADREQITLCGSHAPVECKESNEQYDIVIKQYCG
jgi:hypothetical protein